MQLPPHEPDVVQKAVNHFLQVNIYIFIVKVNYRIQW